MTESRAIQRSARQSPYKMRLVIDQVRGKRVNEAFAPLKFSPKHAAKQIENVLKSAIANAENNNNLSADSLTIKFALIENGPVLKRFKAGARGTAMPRRKKMSHIRIVLTDGSSN